MALFQTHVELLTFNLCLQKPAFALQFARLNYKHSKRTTLVRKTLMSLFDHEAIITLTEVVQQLLRSVLSGFEVEQFWILVNELGVHSGVQELVVGQDILEERDVGLEKQKKTLRWFLTELELIRFHFSFTLATDIGGGFTHQIVYGLKNCYVTKQ